MLKSKSPLNAIVHAITEQIRTRRLNASRSVEQEKANIRKQHAGGKVVPDKLLEAKMAAHHIEGTCTFYGTANSNQMLLAAMGLMILGAAFV